MKFVCFCPQLYSEKETKAIYCFKNHCCVFQHHVAEEDVWSDWVLLAPLRPGCSFVWSLTENSLMHTCSLSFHNNKFITVFHLPNDSQNGFCVQLLERWRLTPYGTAKAFFFSFLVFFLWEKRATGDQLGIN